MSFQTCKTFFHLRNNLRAFWPCIDSKATDIFKAQKGSKDIIKIVCRKHSSKSDMEQKKLLNKVVIFVFFVHKKYSCFFITLRLNHWCRMVYFNDALTTFLGLEHVSCTAVYAGLTGLEHDGE